MWQISDVAEVARLWRNRKRPNSGEFGYNSYFPDDAKQRRTNHNDRQPETSSPPPFLPQVAISSLDIRSQIHIMYTRTQHRQTRTHSQVTPIRCPPPPSSTQHLCGRRSYSNPQAPNNHTTNNLAAKAITPTVHATPQYIEKPPPVSQKYQRKSVNNGTAARRGSHYPQTAP
jgi:hypothetical protein